jgi:uncharacterized delta-60 repeat protein
MTLRALFVVMPALLAAVTACYRHDPLYCDVTADCVDVPGRPFCDTTGEHPASEGIARTCIPDPSGGGGPDGGVPVLGMTATALPHLQVGGSLAVEVRIERPAGSVAAVEVTVPSPPPGIAVAPLAIPSSMSTGALTVTATANMPFGPVALQLVATDGTHAGQTDLAFAVVGVPGTRDTSFGTGGIATVALSDGANMVRSIAHGDGFIAALDNLSLVRVTADGALDATFGDGGRVRLDIAGLGLASIAEIHLAREPDDDIIVVAHGPSSAAPALYHELLARVSRDGDVVQPPRLLHAEPLEDRACGVASVQNGKLVVSSRRGSDLRLKRYHGTGSHDRTFEPLPVVRGWCEVVFAAPDGGVFLRVDQSAIHKLDVAGARDRSFGDLGVAQLATEPSWTTLEALPENRLRIGGSSGGLGVWQLDGSGGADATFGQNGYHTYPSVPNYSQAMYALRQLPDGRLVAIGKLIGNWSQGSGAVMIRLHPDGRPDESFGTSGVMNEDDRWSIDGGFLLDGRGAVFVNNRGGGQIEIRRFWY